MKASLSSAVSTPTCISLSGKDGSNQDIELYKQHQILRISVSDIAAIANYNKWSSYYDLYEKYLYQDLEELHQLDLNKLNIQTAELNLSMVQHVLSVNEWLVLQPILNDTAVTGKFSSSTQVDKSLKTLERVFATGKARATDSITLDRLDLLRKDFTGKVCQRYGQTCEEGALDRYSRIMGFPVEHRNTVSLCWAVPIDNQIDEDMMNLFSRAYDGNLDGKTNVYEETKRRLCNYMRHVDERTDVYKITTEYTNVAFFILGRPDGISDQLDMSSNDCSQWKHVSVVVEAKMRTQRISIPPPLYDLIQLTAYILMSGYYCGDLVQTIKTKDRIRTKMTRSSRFTSTVQPDKVIDLTADDDNEWNGEGDVGAISVRPIMITSGEERVCADIDVNEAVEYNRIGHDFVHTPTLGSSPKYARAVSQHSLFIKQMNQQEPIQVAAAAAVEMEIGADVEANARSSEQRLYPSLLPTCKVSGSPKRQVDRPGHIGVARSTKTQFNRASSVVRSACHTQDTVVPTVVEMGDCGSLAHHVGVQSQYEQPFVDQTPTTSNNTNPISTREISSSTFHIYRLHLYSCPHCGTDSHISCNLNPNPSLPYPKHGFHFFADVLPRVRKFVDSIAELRRDDNLRYRWLRSGGLDKAEIMVSLCPFLDRGQLVNSQGRGAE